MTEVIPEWRRFKLTDLGNAERLVAQHGKDFEFRTAHDSSREAGTWLVWNGFRWVTDETYEIDRRAKETIRALYAAAVEIEDDKQRADFIQYLRDCERQSKLNAMVNRAKREPGMAIPPNAFDQGRWLLNCQNGTLDLRTCRLREHRREDWITRLAPVEYLPNAPPPERWLRFLQEITDNDRELMEFLRQYVGMCLTGDISEQILLILYGEGANGKTVFTDIVKVMLGDYACDAPPNLYTVRRYEEHACELADLHGRRLVIGSEIEEGHQLRVQLIKRLTGDTTLKGRFMRENYFEFERTHKNLIVTNNRPVIREAKHAIWRRVKLFPFGVTIPDDKQDRGLLTKLRAELPGILRWAVFGCRKWQFAGRLYIPADIEKATDQYRDEQDLLSSFLESHCMVAPGARVSRETIWRTYLIWTKDTHEAAPLDRRGLYDRLRLRGFSEVSFREGHKAVRGFRGLRPVLQSVAPCAG